MTEIDLTFTLALSTLGGAFLLGLWLRVQALRALETEQPAAAAREPREALAEA